MKKSRPSRVTPQLLEREAQVVALRRQGLTWDMIAKQVGYSHASGALAAYDNACKRIVHSDVIESRKIEQDRLDILQAAYWNDALSGDVKAGQMIVRIMDRRAKLLGLDMPIKVQQEITVWNGDADIDREIQSLIAQLDAASGSASVLADQAGEN